MKQNKFTLIELIVVIVVLGVLAVIVIPNISNIKNDANKTTIENNIINIQTATDMMLLNDQLPVEEGNIEKLKFGSPQKIDFSKLSPEYLRAIPNIGNYWIDSNNIVSGSEAELPNVRVVDNELTWEAVKNAKKYKVYKEDSSVLSTSLTNKVTLYKTIKHKEGESVYSVTIEGDPNYLVSSVDEYGNETPLVNKDYGSNLSEEVEVEGKIMVVAGYYHNVILNKDGSITFSGHPYDGLAEIMPNENEKDFKYVAAGSNSVVAIRKDGTLSIWGGNEVNENLISNLPNTSKGKFTKVDINSHNGIALREDGTIVVWGDNEYGQVSNYPKSEDNFVDVIAPYVRGVKGHKVVYAVKDNGDIYAWGKNEEGVVYTGEKVSISEFELGWAYLKDGKINVDYDTVFLSTYRTKDVPTSSDFVQVSVGEAHGIALKKDGTYIVWGHKELTPIPM